MILKEIRGDSSSSIPVWGWEFGIPSLGLALWDSMFRVGSLELEFWGFQCPPRFPCWISAPGSTQLEELIGGKSPWNSSKALKTNFLLFILKKKKRKKKWLFQHQPTRCKLQHLLSVLGRSQEGSNEEF